VTPALPWPHCCLQVAAALLALQVVPGAGGGSSGQQQDLEQQQQQPAPADVPLLGPELERLLQQQPGSNARELYQLWQQGVPLEALGSMHSGNMPVSDEAPAVFQGDWGRGRGRWLWQQARNDTQGWQEALQCICSQARKCPSGRHG
jgi:hypothetical protein